MLVLDDLPIGPATVTISGYIQGFAPAPADVTTTCKTVNTSGVAPCDPSRLASPAYESAPKAVTILPGTRVNLGDVDIFALPFLLDYVPPQDSQAQSPLALRFTVVDADTGIAASSVALDVTFEAAQPPAPQRLPLTLLACADGGDEPCSAQGSLGVSGFKAQATVAYPPALPVGAVTVRITAENLAAPPRGLDFAYRFTALPQPTATATATSTLVPTLSPTPSSTPTASHTATLPPPPTRSATATLTRSATLTRTPTFTPTPRPTPVDTATSTVTPTRTFTEVPTPTPTTLCAATPRTGCRNAPNTDLRLKVAAGGDSLDWRWISGNAPLREFGDPTSTTTYALCIYDAVNHVPHLAFVAQVEPGGFCHRSPCWSTVGSPPIGYRFVDSDGLQYGIEKLLLRDRSAARDSIIAQGGGDQLELPLPVGVDQFFAQQDNVVVQLVNDVAGCWESLFRPGDVMSNTSVLYEAAR